MADNQLILSHPAATHNTSPMKGTHANNSMGLP